VTDTCFRDPEGEGFTPYLYAYWYSLDEDLSDSYDLVYEILYHTVLDDAESILDTIASIKATYKQSITESVYQLQYTRAAAATDPMTAYNLYLNGLDYFQFLNDVEARVAEDPDAVIEKLEAIQDYFHNRTGAIAAFSGSEASIAVNRSVADNFLAKLGDEPRTRVTYDVPSIASSEAIVVDSAVQYNLLYADYATLGLEGFTGDLDAVCAVVSDAFLYPLLRDQYGAYGVIHNASDTGMYIISYRDPNIKETFAVYDQLPDMLSQIDMDQATLDGYIMSAYSMYAMSGGELTGATSAILNKIEGKGAADTIEIMRSLKGLTVEKLTEYASVYETLMEKGLISTAGGASAIRENEDLYETILDPFAADQD
jgi:Zn-dependent M16 (insulinase) family peptidase